MEFSEKLVRKTPNAHVRALLRSTGLLRVYGQTEGSPEFRIALIDGSIFTGHPSLKDANIKVLGNVEEQDSRAPEVAHATFIASMLVGRGEGVVGLCPACALISVPAVNSDLTSGNLPAPVVARRVARAVTLAIAEGADVIQLSLEFPTTSRKYFDVLFDVLENAGSKGVIVVMPTGNQGSVESNFLLNASSVIPVAMSGWNGLPHPRACLGPAVARRGFLAPGTDIPGAVPPDDFSALSGSSYAAAFATGAIALMNSRLPGNTRKVRKTLFPRFAYSAFRSGLVPQPLDMEASFSVSMYA